MKNVLNIKFEAKQFKIKLYKALDIIYYFFYFRLPLLTSIGYGWRTN